MNLKSYNVKIKTILIVLGVVFSMNFNAQKRITAELKNHLVVPAITKESPRLWYTTERLAFLKDAYQNKTQPHIKAINKIISIARNALTIETKPYSGSNPDNFRSTATSDSRRAVCLALAYHITGDKAYQQKAAEIVLAWAKAMPGGPLSILERNTRFPNVGLDTYCGTSGLVLTYDLLVHNKTFNSDEKKNIDDWFLTLAKAHHEAIYRWSKSWKVVNRNYVESSDPKDLPYFGGQYFQNHVVESQLGLLEIGYALGDKQLVQYVLDSDKNPRDLKKMISGAIHIKGDSIYSVFKDTAVITKIGLQHKKDLSKRNWASIPPETGEMYDRYRTISGSGIGYSLHCLNLLLQAAELTMNNGIDFYHFNGKKGQNLLLPLVYYADFAITADCTIKSGYYVWSDIDQTKSLGEHMEIWELGAVRYPQKSELFNSVLTCKYYNRGEVGLYNVHNPLMSWLLAVGE
jgi:hypothetical protein